ncbi:MAG: hypothetical protein P4L98_11195 [Ancalomicrobiaceae bacterium]|nr:hypothetical protein [Ancalomicrobiaceae bacterium]
MRARPFPPRPAHTCRSFRAASLAAALVVSAFVPTLADDRPAATAPQSAPVGIPAEEAVATLSVSEVLDQFDDYVETTLTVEGRLALLGTRDAVLKQDALDAAGLTIDLGELPVADQTLLHQRCRTACAAVVTGRAGRIMARPGIVAYRLEFSR